MANNTQKTTHPASPQDASKPRRKPSRGWYLLSAFLLIGSASVFALTLIEKAGTFSDRIMPMPRFVGPTGDEGVVVTLDQPGRQNIFYENRGTFEGKDFDTPRRQVWTTYASPAMTCTVSDAESGEPIPVYLVGSSDEDEARSKTSKDPVITYSVGSVQGHSAWVFDAPAAGGYRIVLRYVDEVSLEPSEIEVPPELTKDQKKQMDSEEGAAYEQARREAQERIALAGLEPIDVLFAVGPDPMAGAFFEVIGLKGAATVLAFGFTFSVLITLVTLMLRGGHVTPRGELSGVQRGLPGINQ